MNDPLPILSGGGVAPLDSMMMAAFESLRPAAVSPAGGRFGMALASVEAQRAC